MKIEPIFQTLRNLRTRLQNERFPVEFIFALQKTDLGSMAIDVTVFYGLISPEIKLNMGTVRIACTNEAVFNTQFEMYESNLRKNLELLTSKL